MLFFFSSTTINFDGVNDYVSVADDSTLDITGDLKVSSHITASGGSNLSGSGGNIEISSSMIFDTCFLLTKKNEKHFLFCMVRFDQ